MSWDSYVIIFEFYNPMEWRLNSSTVLKIYNTHFDAFEPRERIHVIR